MLETQTTPLPGANQAPSPWPESMACPLAGRVHEASDFPPIIEMPVPPGWDGVDRRETLAKGVPPELDRRVK